MLEAAAELIREQGNVTLEEVASRAQISRATAYRYFSDVNDLIIATQLPATKEPEELLEGVDDVVERALIVHDHLFEASENSESHMRAFLGAIRTLHGDEKILSADVRFSQIFGTGGNQVIREKA